MTSLPQLARTMWLLRECRHLTQEGLARRLHTTRQTVSNWECGAKQPTMRTLVRVAGALDVPVTAFFALVEAGPR